MPNLNELTYYADPCDQWAATRELELRAQHWAGWRAYDESDAESWARSRESWLREQGFLRYRIRVTMKQIAIQLAPTIQSFTESMNEAGRLLRSLGVVLQDNQA